MSDLCKLIWCALLGLFRSRVALEAEILVLRHQLNVLRRKSPKRLAFGNIDRLVFAGLYRVAPGALDALKILKPQTDGDPLAPRRLPSLLALAIKASRWPAEDVTRDPTAHSRHEHRKRRSSPISRGGFRRIWTDPVDALVHRVFDFHGRPRLLTFAYQPRFPRALNYTTDQVLWHGLQGRRARIVIRVGNRWRRTTA